MHSRSVVCDSINKFPVRHHAGPDNVPVCGTRGNFKPLTPGQEPLFDLCHRCDAVDRPKTRAETRPSRARANGRQTRRAR